MTRSQRGRIARTAAAVLWMVAAVAFGAGPVVTVTNATGAVGTGGLAVATLDPATQPLSGACLELWTDAGGGTRGTLVADSARCDAPLDPTGLIGPQDGRPDGSLGWSDLAPGNYVVVETGAPSGGPDGAYETAADTPATVAPGAAARLSLVHRPLAAVTVYKVDAAGAPLPGACFAVIGPERTGGSLCDGTQPGNPGPPGDGLADGILVFGNLDPTLSVTDFTLHEVYPPDGYAATADQPLTIAFDRPTVVTVTNATGPPVTGGATEVVSLEFEMESTIDVRLLGAMPVSNGHTMASGRIVLEPDGAGSWRGSGALVSTTTSDDGTGCPSVQVRGEGVYDWVIRNVHAGPDLAIDDFEVSMDAGPIVETPDVATTDMCSTSFDGDTNTWENLFFNVYLSRFLAHGLLVDGWTQVGSGDAWSTGGLVAEATWTGDCVAALILDCTDHTTFRMYGRATAVAPTATPGPSPTGAAAASASPTSAAGESPAAASPSISPSGTPAVGGGEPAACADIVGCNAIPIALIAFAGLIGAVVIGFMWLRTMGARRLTPLPPPQGRPDFEKHPPDFEKHPPDFDK